MRQRRCAVPPMPLTKQRWRASSAPDTERDIVSVESYGRQLGRVIDALAESIKERLKSAPQKLALNVLVSLFREEQQ